MRRPIWKNSKLAIDWLFPSELGSFRIGALLHVPTRRAASTTSRNAIASTSAALNRRARLLQEACWTSQITAVVEQATAGTGSHKTYQIAARAELVAPFAVKLAGPRVLFPEERSLIDEVSDEGKTVDDWNALTQRLRRTSTK